jgi:hypothetical protein
MINAYNISLESLKVRQHSEEFGINRMKQFLLNWDERV